MIDGKYGFIDPDGKIVIFPIFEEAGFFWNREYAVVTLNGKKGWIKKDGSYLVEPLYDDTFHHRKWIEVYKDGKYGVLSADGKMIAPCIFDQLETLRGDDNVYVRYGDDWFRIPLQGPLD